MLPHSPKLKWLSAANDMFVSMLDLWMNLCICVLWMKTDRYLESYTREVKHIPKHHRVQCWTWRSVHYMYPADNVLSTGSFLLSPMKSQFPAEKQNVSDDVHSYRSCMIMCHRLRQLYCNVYRVIGPSSLITQCGVVKCQVMNKGNWLSAVLSKDSIFKRQRLWQDAYFLFQCLGKYI